MCASLLTGSSGTFLRILQPAETTDVPVEPEHWGCRCGEPVTDTIDRWVDHAAAELVDLVETVAAEADIRLR
ncbi:hypothetical protein [Nocardioides plantarum]|uniref:Uncharacterized protein n=1 Tax=Nocardioides plantarum TaxID=29299 RepID=A0ABV5KD67_9ACTN|nr:hypothetical protein [Nocardioides plantarum]